MRITDTFGFNVRLYRKKSNLSQESLASMSNLHRTYIGAIERGERNITIINAEKIATALKINIGDLFLEPKKWKTD